MKFPPNSILFKGVHTVYDRFGHTLPMEYTGARDEILASRQTACSAVPSMSRPSWISAGQTPQNF